MHVATWLLWSLTILAQGGAGPTAASPVPVADTSEPVVAEASVVATDEAVGDVAAPDEGIPHRRSRSGLAALRVPALPVPRLTAWEAAAVRSPSARVVAVSPLPADTPPPLPLVEYTDAYATRLKIHRWASWAMLPLFAAQYASGQQLLEKGATAPAWARNSHGVLAASVAGLFAVNTVTGVWNLWDSRKDPEGRGWRTAHGVLMLLADAGFAATGALADAAEGSSADRSLHKNVAISSMAVAGVSVLMMLPPFRRD